MNAKDPKDPNKYFALVEVIWYDSLLPCPRWRYLEATDPTPQSLRCHSIGYLIADKGVPVEVNPDILKKTNSSIRIAPHVSVDADGDIQVCGDMEIPVCSIQKFNVIRNVQL